MNNSLEGKITAWKNAQFIFETFIWALSTALISVFITFLICDVDSYYNFKRDSLLSPYFANQAAWDEYYSLQSEHYYRGRYACKVFVRTGEFLTYTFDSVEELYLFDYGLDDDQHMECGLNSRSSDSI